MENTPKNMVLLGDSPWPGNYMAGYVAAKMSESGKLGILQPFPSPGLNRYSNCFYFGAKDADPDIDVKVVYLGDYLAPAETRDAVKSLAQEGCDVIFSEMDDNSAIYESQAQGIYCIQMYIDKNDVAPETVLTSVVFDWSKPLKGAVEAVAKGNWDEYRKTNYFSPVKLEDDSLYLGKFAPSVPNSLKNEMKKVRQELIDGTREVPLVTDEIIK
jgi:basic membrane lipoprotein Med (substrate-binding protein (PBP1-ABC) superfamily)